MSTAGYVKVNNGNQNLVMSESWNKSAISLWLDATRIANRQQIPQVYWGKTLAWRVKKQALEMAQQIEQVEKQLAELLAVGRFAPHHRA